MGAPAILNASGDPVPSSEISRIRVSAMMGGFPTDYETPYRASSIWSQETAAWRPPMRSGDFAGLIRRDLTVARIQDVIRNDPHASTALDKLVDMIVGSGLNLSAKPDGPALGVSDAGVLHDIKRKMQGEWRLFANDPRRLVDAQRKLSAGGLFRLLARTWLTYGEASYCLTLNNVSGARYETSVMTVSPNRICNPSGERDTMTRRGGVEMDPVTFAPIGYWVRDAHLGDYWAPSEQVHWTYVPKETAWGRPVFVHGFEPLEDDDTRGTSPLIPIIVKLRMLGKFADNELASATINALFAASVESDLPVAAIAERMGPKDYISASQSRLTEVLEHYEQFPARVGGARIPVMLPGSKITMNASPRQTTAFPAFEAAFLQTVAAKLGLSYEQLKGDWTKTNYSSARAALNETWRTIRRMSTVFVEQIVHPLQLAWADEAFDKRYLTEPEGAPDFWDMPGAYLNARWNGPGRGYVDPVKEAEAPALRIEGMISTLEDENAEQGVDLEDRLDQIQYEEAALKDRGLTRLSLVAVEQGTRGPKPDSPEASGPAGVEGDETGKAASASHVRNRARSRHATDDATQAAEDAAHAVETAVQAAEAAERALEKIQLMLAHSGDVDDA